MSIFQGRKMKDGWDIKMMDDSSFDKYKNNDFRFVIFILKNEEDAIQPYIEYFGSKNESYSDFVTKITESKEPRCAVLNFTYHTMANAFRDFFLFISYIPDDFGAKIKFKSSTTFGMLMGLLNSVPLKHLRIKYEAQTIDDLDIRTVLKKISKGERDQIDYSKPFCGFDTIEYTVPLHER